MRVKSITFPAIAALTTLAIFGIISTPVLADSQKQNPVKERQILMRSVGKAMKTSVKMAQGKLPYDQTAAMNAMKTMGDVAKTYTSLFPEGSDMTNSIMDFDKESDAKPEIWANMDDFILKTKALGNASANALSAAAGGKDSFAGAIGAVGKTCKNCHEKYKSDE